MQDNAEKVAHLENEANAANQEVVQLADEVEKRDALVEQLQEVLHALKQQLDCQSKASMQQQETLSARWGITFDMHIISCKPSLNNNLQSYCYL